MKKFLQVVVCAVSFAVISGCGNLSTRAEIEYKALFEKFSAAWQKYGNCIAVYEKSINTREVYANIFVSKEYPDKEISLKTSTEKLTEEQHDTLISHMRQTNACNKVLIDDLQGTEYADIFAKAFSKADLIQIKALRREIDIGTLNVELEKIGFDLDVDGKSLTNRIQSDYSRRHQVEIDVALAGLAAFSASMQQSTQTMMQHNQTLIQSSPVTPKVVNCIRIGDQINCTQY